MKNRVDMIGGRLVPNMLRFAVPLIISSVLQVFYNSADTFIVGRYDDALSMGAVSSAGGIIGCVVNLFIGMAVGVNILAARFFGAGDMDSVKKYGGNAIVMGGAFGVFVCLLGQACAKPLVELIGVDPVIQDRCITYIRIYLLGVPFSALFNFVSAFLQGTGDTKKPTLCLIVSGACNVVMNIIFVKQFGLGVAGVAAATSISMLISFVLAFVFFIKSAVGVRTRDIRFDRRICGNIIKMGFPVGIQNFVNSISNIFTTSAMNSFGAAAISGESIEIQVESLLGVGVGAISAAMITATSQNLGAGNYKRISQIFKVGFLIEVVYALVGGAIGYALRMPVVDMFAQGNSEVAMYALIKFDFIILPYVTVAIQEAPSAMLRGVGGTFPAMVVAMCGCLFRILWILFLLPIPQFHNVGVLFLSYPIVWAVSGVASYVIYRRKKGIMERAALRRSGNSIENFA